MATLLAGCADKTGIDKNDPFITKWKTIAKEAEKSAVSSSAPAEQPEAVNALPPDKTDIDKNDPVITKWKKIAEKAEKSTASSSAPAEQPEAVNALPPEVSEGAASQEALPEKVELERPLPSQKISINITDAEIIVIIRALARAVDQNIVVSGEVKGKTSIYVKDIPWRDAFASFLKAHGLGYTWDGDIIRIKTAEDMKKEAESLIQAKKIDTNEILTNRVVKIHYVDPKLIKNTLEKFLTKDEKMEIIGAIGVDEPTNSLIIQATATNMKGLLPMIREMDKPTTQVLLKAQIVETTQTTAKDLGVKWSGAILKNDGNATHWLHGPHDWTTTPDPYLFWPTDPSIDPQFWGQPKSWMPPLAPMVNLPIDVAGKGIELGYQYENLGSVLLDFDLQALQEQGKLHILSSPSITALSNTRAIFESGKDVPFVTYIQQSGQILQVIEWRKASLKLEVIPHVIDEKTVKLAITTTNDELDFSKTVQGNPLITTKEATSNVVLLDGQTTVIGGLRKESNNHAASGIPGLMDIPGIGRLFKSTSDASEQSELMIFITPYILKSPQNIATGLK